jgi:hypothetical protein
MMSKALSNLQDCCGMFIDDVVVFSDNWENHLRDVERVLQRLRDANLTVKLAKCFFACTEIDYLGHTVGIGRMTPRRAKVEALMKCERPHTRKQLQSFLGLAGFFQRYLPRYAELTSPLTELLRKGREYVWGEKEDKAFNKVKEMLCDQPILQIADYSQPFTLYIDASNVAVGGVLMQRDEAGTLRPVCYFSKKLNDAQKNYSTRDKESLALILSVRAFRVYLSGPVDVYTDHEPLKFINTMACTNQRLLRWAMELQPYQLNVKHVKGKDNVIADYLSRPCFPPEDRRQV